MSSKCSLVSVGGMSYEFIMAIPSMSGMDGQIDMTIRRTVQTLLSQFQPEERTGKAWLDAAYKAGLAWVSFPVGLGGLGAPVGMQALVDEELGRAGATLREDPRYAVGYGLAAPVLVEFAQPTVVGRMLPPLFRLDEFWCQLFSEPGSGSDIASLATSAVRDGDVWRINGQKVWTTLGHISKWALLATRTDPTVPKHKGLTFFVLDMDQPGVEVRPLRQMTGDAEFNEVFLTDAVVPDELRLGDVGEGWRVVVATLANERHTVADVGSTPAGNIERAIELYRAIGDRPGRAATRDRLMSLWVRDMVVQLLMDRTDHEGSLDKLGQTKVKQDILKLCIDLMGPIGMLYPETGYRPAGRDASSEVMEDLRWQFLRSRAGTVEGGTSEVMKNIIGERVLGLAKEPAVDRDVAWRDLRR